ncbi:outer membrane assembly lipoprotein YfiO [Pseudomonas sp. GV071]|uniref:outer membrane assembly lipoprotein YfiO n=1 Tax=Pseudomonas sp. GV071 TaxID=2135754 RepID=UPI000D35B228|nr:outer membrane assembly lipoprotein YfiO [Pseudomonas sp. GV071]PTQ72859.1 hypothetical protein C8K61_10267 [Pseudomonas sp. GV071]
MNRLALALLVLGTPLAHASFDDSECAPSLLLQSSGLDSCSTQAFLSPGNDTRANLQWLLSDAGQPSLAGNPEKAEDQNALVPFALEQLFTVATPDAAPTDTPTEADANSLSAQIEKLGLSADYPDLSQAPSYASGEGSRQSSNNTDTAATFLAQLLTSDLPDPERKRLARQRLTLLQQEHPASEPQPLNFTGVQSILGRQFATYLQGASAFYDGDFAAASARFTELLSSEQAWLKETASYMVARSQLNAAQANAFDEYGYPDLSKADQPALVQTETDLQQYLASYPQGDYALSAKGLLRRVYWLQQDNVKLAAAYAEQLAEQDLDKRDSSLQQLTDEVDNKLFTSAQGVTNPMLLAVIDLKGMRSGEPISKDQLLAQKPLFADEPDLYAYLQGAWHYYVGEVPAEALKFLPEATDDSVLDHLHFSQQIVRGLALEEDGQWPAAQAHWLKLFKLTDQPIQLQQLQLALALNYEHSNQVEKIFAADSLVTNSNWRAQVLGRVASPELLRQLAKDGKAATEESITALSVLLYKDLLQGHYQAFSDDLALVPEPAPEALKQFVVSQGTNDDGYACPTPKETAEVLEKQPANANALNCLGEFTRTHSLVYDGSPGEFALSGSKTQFPGERFDPLHGYQQIIANDQAPADDRAYALYRAINCYATSGYNHCNGDDIDKSVRKQWFSTLKRQYANSTWAQSLKYYW